MSQYTPTTDEVRAIWREWNGYGGLIDRTVPEPTTRAGMVAEFDRWLDQERAAARREGQTEAWDEGYSVGYSDNDPWGPTYPATAPNPYRNGADR